MTYDRVAAIQKKAARFLVEKVHTLDPTQLLHRILDVGTGTGYIPEHLLSLYPNATYYLNDVAENMLAICKQKFSNHKAMHFIQGDMNHLVMDPCDLVISNFALQWTDAVQATLQHCYQLASNTFAFSTLLAGTFDAWQTIVNQYAPIKLHTYPTLQDMLSCCNEVAQDHTFHYWTVAQPLTFNTPLAFMRYLKALGASTAEEHLSPSLLKTLLNEQHQPLTATYHIFFGMFKR